MANNPKIKYTIQTIKRIHHVFCFLLPKTIESFNLENPSVTRIKPKSIGNIWAIISFLQIRVIPKIIAKQPIGNSHFVLDNPLTHA